MNQNSLTLVWFERQSKKVETGMVGTRVYGLRIGFSCTRVRKVNTNSVRTIHKPVDILGGVYHLHGDAVGVFLNQTTS